MTRQYSDSIALAAREIVAASGMDITQPAPILPLAKQVQQRTGCGIDAAKRHVARAIRMARHETTTAPAWGGRRTPAGGRPPMKKIMMKLYDSGPVAGETWAPGTGGTLAYSVSPSPAFTGLDGAQDAPGEQPADGEPLNQKRFNAHLRARRQASGVKWEDALAAHIARYPHEADGDAQRKARPTYP